MNSVPFQSLSRCEAIQLHKDVIVSIAKAYQGGLLDSFWLTKSGIHPKELIDNARYRLNESGLTASEDFAAVLVAEALAEIVRKEEQP